MVLVTITLLGLLVGLLYQFLTWNFDYWRKRKIPGPKPELLTGNFPNLYKMKRHAIYDLDDIYRKYKQDYNAVGIYSGRSPQLLILNPELAHRIFVSDFKSFHDNELSNFIDEKSDFIFANNIFTLTGDKWKQRRADITPGLTMSRIKTVYPVTNEVCRKLNDFIRKQIRIGVSNGVNGKDISLCFTTEMVTDCVLGLSAQSFSDNPTPIMDKIKNLFNQSWKLILSFVLVSIFPIILRFKKLRLIPEHVENFFVNLLQSAIDAREAQMVVGKQFERVDFLDYILQLKKKQNLNTRQLTACTMTFLIDGFETTASVLAHTLLCLGRDAKAQQRLREEIQSNLNDKGFVDFEKIHDLPFLDACIQETMRIFPVLPTSNKLCTNPIDITNRNGKSFTIDMGTTVVIPHFCFMNDKDYFPNSEAYQPDRFLEPNSAKSYRDHGIFMAFGDGPRICIGMRFALTQIKAALVEVLTNFDIKINPKTRKDNLIDPYGIVPKLQGDIWLDFATR